jgi:uncharacterized phage protein gp47/JayE
MIGDQFNKYTFDYLIGQALARVPDTVDKRQGSIIYDALAPACYELAGFYMELAELMRNTFITTATGDYLDMRAAEQGLTREVATYSIRRGDFYDDEGIGMDVPIGSRFSTVGTDTPLVYVVVEPYKEGDVTIGGSYRMQCETAGTVGDSYSGELLPITFIPDLADAELTDILKPGQDIETDEAFRIRYDLAVTEPSFGGNVAQYKDEVKKLDGVGDLQIYPVWNGGGTVKLSIVDGSYSPISQAFIDSLQTQIDPENAAGVNGLGLGIAPIGHKVTVTTPTGILVNVTGSLILKTGYVIEQVQTAIEQQIDAYLKTLRQEWAIPVRVGEDSPYELTVFLAQISAAILRAAGVASVSNIAINGVSADLVLQQTAAVQEIPIMGSVILT